MPRPCKRRRVCFEPACKLFTPAGSGAGVPTITLTLDEFETIRLIDYLGRSQEECAESMHVARTTAQAIYGSARAKLATSLVQGMALRIEGGDIVLCTGREAECTRCGLDNEHGGCQCNFRRVKRMRIAVTYEDGQIFQHFGHTKHIKLYMIEGSEVKSSVVLPTVGSGHGALAGFLAHNQVETLICGGIGGGAQQALQAAGIKLFAGVSGDADAAVEALLKGTLRYVSEATCSHHDHEDGHDCHCDDHDHDCGGSCHCH